MHNREARCAAWPSARPELPLWSGPQFTAGGPRAAKVALQGHCIFIALARVGQAAGPKARAPTVFAPGPICGVQPELQRPTTALLNLRNLRNLHIIA